MPTIPGIESKITGFLRTDLNIEAQTATIDVDFVDEDNNNTPVTLQADTLEFAIDPLNETGNGVERIHAASRAAHPSVSGRTRLSTVERGLERYGTGQTGVLANAKQWPQGTRVAVSTDSLMRAVNIIKSVLAGTAGTGANTFLLGDGLASDKRYAANTDAGSKPALEWDDSLSRWVLDWGSDAPASGRIDGLGMPYLTEAERDARTWPDNGVVIQIADGANAGEYLKRQGGAWIVVSSGGVFPFASTAVAGSTEIADTTEANAGDDSGATGATTVMPPSQTARVIQDAKYVYAADSQASDTYVITLVPALTAYATGQTFYFKANTANTGAATLNVNGLGAKTIKKQNDVDLETGDIESGQIVQVTYDGTNFQMLSPSANRELVDGSDVGFDHVHGLDSAEQQFRVNGKEFYPATTFEAEVSGGVIYEGGNIVGVETSAANNNMASVILGASFPFTASVHNKNPKFCVRVQYNSAAAQEGFIGYANMSGASLENSVMTIDHFGFVIEDATLYASVADGATQTKSAAIPATITNWNTYKATFDGTTALFYLNGSLVATLNTNVPNSSLTQFRIADIADASAAQKLVKILRVMGAEFDTVN